MVIETKVMIGWFNLQLLNVNKRNIKTAKLMVGKPRYF